ncbi:MAG: exosortase/archaeosortase family protein [Phycisphaerales bacterium]|nr:exosortase/archaeosortase family protein [Phycisphaerales bacterium]
MSGRIRHPMITWQVPALAGLLGAAAWMQRDALLDIWAIGSGVTDQSHILMAPLVAAYLFWLRRSRLRSTPLVASPLGPVLVVVGWLMTWGGVEINMDIARHFGALVTLLGAIVSVTGLQVVRRFAPAFLAMLFVLPVPGSVRHVIAIPLQGLATSVTHSMLDFMAIPVVRNGFVLSINGEPVAIGEACNGMRMVFALWLVVYAFAFSLPLRTGTRLLLLGMSPVVALLANVIRLIPTSIVFGYGSIEQAELFHDVAGWVMLCAAVLLLIGTVRLIRWLDLPVTRYRLATQ